MLNKNMYFPFWILAISIAIGLTLPNLIKDGMFMDAVLYTSVSHNMSLGQGSFWFPYFDEFNIIGLSSFHEQPPLVFTIQSYFFRLLGDSIYVERFYTFCTLIMHILLINILWKCVYKNKGEDQKMAWMAIIVWITIPVCFWSFSNNMHENTMSIFVLLASISAFTYYQKERLSIVYFMASGIFICLAFLSKGFPGLFPICIPFVYFLFNTKYKFKQMALHTSIVFLTILMIGIILYFYGDSHQSIFINYLQKRAMQRINEVPSVENRYFILVRLFSELIPAFILLLVTYLVARYYQITDLFFKYRSTAFIFLCLGLFGSLPLLLTKVQNGFYMVASFPYYAIGFASLAAPVYQYLIEHYLKNMYKLLSVKIFSFMLPILVLVFSFTQIHAYSREEIMLQDVYLIGKQIPKFSYLKTATDIEYNDWDMQAYLMRYFNIGFRKNGEAPYLIIQKNNIPASPDLYTKLELNTTMYDIYIKK